MTEPKKDMTRAEQTWWILGGLAMVLIVALAFGLKYANEDPRYPGCTQLFGIKDLKCKTDMMLERGYI